MAYEDAVSSGFSSRVDRQTVGGQPMRVQQWCGRGLLALVLIAGFAGLAGCRGEPAGDPLGATNRVFLAERERPSDSLFVSSRLAGLVSGATEGDRRAVVSALDDAMAPVRRRAALLAASLGGPEFTDGLLRLLEDPESVARRDAAFALGRGMPENGLVVSALLARLEIEEDEAVRQEVWRALGRLGSEQEVSPLLEGLGAEAALGGPIWALADLAVRGRAGTRDSEVISALAAALQSDDAQARSGAAWGLARIRNPARLEPAAEGLLRALSASDPSDPAFPWLITAVLTLGVEGGVSERQIIQLLDPAAPEAALIQALRGVGSVPASGAQAIREHVFERLTHPSVHVGAAAGAAVASWLGQPEQSTEMWSAVRGAVPGLSGLEWQRVRPLFEVLSEVDPAWLREWALERGGESPVALSHAVRALGSDVSSETESLLFRSAKDPEPLVRAAAIDALSQLWQTRRTEALDSDHRGRFAVAFADEAMSGPPPSAMRAARHLLDPQFQDFQTLRVLEEALALHYRDGNHHLVDSLSVVLGESRAPRVIPLLESLAGSSLGYRIRRAGDLGLQAFDGRPSNPSQMDAPNPEYPLDWRFLATLGPRPRLEIITERGTLLLELDAEQAPQTVQAIADQANSGFHDGTRFHRVVPNFVIQAGDVSLGDGSGGPGYSIRTESTWIPFERGVIGMASIGRDTEGSQWFITHSRQPHLDGEYTAFGWILSGWAVLDEILEGDLIRTMRVKPDPQWLASF